MKIYIGENHGCDLNYTYRVLTDELYSLGEIVKNVEDADIIVFPASCSGSLKIIKKVMNDILNVLKNKKKDAITFITGCMTSDIKDSYLRNMISAFLNENFDYVISEQNMENIVNIISQKNKMENSFGACISSGNQVDLYISKGCANKCSFCKVNYLNLPIKSVDFEDVRDCIVSLPDEIDTVNLLGMNTSQYGLDFGYEHNLMDIIKLLENKESVTSVRIDGMAFKDAIQNNFSKDLKTKKIKRIGGSIETGSPRLLSLMDKGYTIQDLLSFWDEINEFNQKDLSTDVIVGFPTETYKDIELTMQLLDILRPGFITLRKYQNSPYIPSNKYNQLTEEEISEHYDVYVKELKLRGCLL